MIKGAVAARYAQALFDIAQDTDNIAGIEGELRGVIQALDESRDFQKVIFHPQVPAGVKKEIVKELFAGEISKTSFNFLCVILERHREFYLKAICEAYINLANQTRNIAEVEVTSALELPMVHKVNLMQALSKMTGKEIRVKYQTDPEILGGLVVRLGDRIVDASVKRQLERVKERIRETQVG
ncbi:MAG: F0F1 ATP synthase subunit delta [Desulforudis sp.]|jgi:F-type H+-transporting ATPase subunit delta|nr:MAG: F0F1 ATP synthase subunit delta [Desulforudis sp.]